MAVPRYHGLFNPMLQALRHLGGSASIPEMEEEVIKLLGLTNEEIAEPHDERRTKFEYRLAWARTYIKVYGLVDNSERGVWVVLDHLRPGSLGQSAQARTQVAYFGLTRL